MPASVAASLDFNCTIQELKHELLLRIEGLGEVFQLHHTGIKTRRRWP